MCHINKRSEKKEDVKTLSPQKHVCQIYFKTHARWATSSHCLLANHYIISYFNVEVNLDAIQKGKKTDSTDLLFIGRQDKVKTPKSVCSEILRHHDELICGCHN